MNRLLVRAERPTADGSILSVTPERAGWGYVGFEVLSLSAAATAARTTDGLELCVVVVEGSVGIACQDADWASVGGRPDPWSGLPDAVYLPSGRAVTLTAGADGCELGLCWAPAESGAARPRLLPGGEIEEETRGWGMHQRQVRPILMGDRDAQSLLVCEVLTPAGHWSSYPPHKHDALDPPRETFLEETYYHRIRPDRGFGLQRVYTEDLSLDEAIAFRDRDCVLVPRGYHTVSAPPGYDLYYLNVMAGPRREWAVTNDPDHEWMLNHPERV